MGAKHNQEFLTIIARELVEVLPLRIPRYEQLGGQQFLYQDYAAVVYQKVRRFKPETLGRIASVGKAGGQGGASLFSVHCSIWLDKHATGKQLLREIAVTTIIAKMFDLLTEGRFSRLAA